MCIIQFLSTNGCRVDTNDPLLYFFRFLNLKYKSVAVQFFSCSMWLKKALFYTYLRNLSTNQRVKPHIDCFYKKPFYHSLVEGLVLISQVHICTRVSAITVKRNMVGHKPMIYQLSNFYTIFTYFIYHMKRWTLKNYGV